MRGHANTHTQTRTHVLTRTFPGGDESGQELAEVGAGIGVVQGKGFQLGGRASVLDVGLLHSVDVRLQESCSAERGRNFMEGRKLRAIRRWAASLCGFLLVSYLQKGPRRSAGRPRGAGWRRRGARGSSRTRPPARHTHTARQSSVIHGGTHTHRQKEAQKSWMRRTTGQRSAPSSPTHSVHGEKVQPRPSAGQLPLPPRLEGGRGRGSAPPS